MIGSTLIFRGLPANAALRKKTAVLRPSLPDLFAEGFAISQRADFPGGAEVPGKVLYVIKTQRFGDLSDRPAFDAAEFEDLAGLGREWFEAFVNAVQELVVGDLVVGAMFGLTGKCLIVSQISASGACFANAVDHFEAHRRKKVVVERGAGQRAPLVPEAGENVLHNLFGNVFLPELVECNLVKRVPVLIVNGGKSPFVPGAQSF